MVWYFLAGLIAGVVGLLMFVKWWVGETLDLMDEETMKKDGKEEADDGQEKK